MLNQQKTYQSVVAPFDGVITQRNIDVGSLVQADATSGTFLFTLMHSDMIRIQLYVPQDEAFGVTPGVEAVVRVPEMPGREFPGTVTRIADALQPGTRTLSDRDRRTQSGPCAIARSLLHRRTEDPAQDAVADRSRPRRSSSTGTASVSRWWRTASRAIHKVTVVRDFGTTVEVNAGVKDGDQVILNPAVDLTDGRKVQVRPGPPAQLS